MWRSGIQLGLRLPLHVRAINLQARSISILSRPAAPRPILRSAVFYSLSSFQNFYRSYSNNVNKKKQPNNGERKGINKGKGANNSSTNGEKEFSFGDVVKRAQDMTPKKPKEESLPASEVYNMNKPSLHTNPQGRPPEMPIPEFLLKKPKVAYSPQDNYERVTYEFHVPPSPTEVQRKSIIEKYFKSTWYRFIPVIIVFMYGAWLMYLYFFVNPPDQEGKDFLKEDEFLPYLITYKEKLKDDWYLIEVTRRRRVRAMVSPLVTRNLFNGKKIWSVEVRQPDINIVRNLTPLPVFIPNIDPETKEPHFRIVSEDIHEGRFCFLVKRYGQGEFSRWFTSLNLLSEVELRGPKVEFEFPAHPLDREDPRPQMGPLPKKIKIDPHWPDSIPRPNDFAFFTAGTGIAPLLQVLLSPNPPKGFIDAFVSLPSEDTLPEQFRTLSYLLEKAGRVKMHYIFSDKGERLDQSYVPVMNLPKFSGALDSILSKEQSDLRKRDKLMQKKLEEVRNQVSGNDQRESNKIENVEVVEEDYDETKPKQLGYDVNAVPKFDDIDESDFDPRLFASNAIEQQERETRKQLKKTWTSWLTLGRFGSGLSTQDDAKQCVGSPSFAVVCGPDSYIRDVSGKPNLNNLEGRDTGELGGYLKAQKWDLKHVKRLQ